MKNPVNFDEVYRQHWEKLYVFCLKLTNDEDLSKNIVQDIFVDLWQRQEKTSISDISAYLFGAAKKQILKAYRRKQFDTRVLEDCFEDYLVENSNEADNPLIEKLYKLLDTLPIKRREIVILNKLEQLKIDEIAARLNVSPQTVKNQLTTALKQMKIGAAQLSVISLPPFLPALFFLTIC